jgi:hypothetical protein
MPEYTHPTHMVRREQFGTTVAGATTEGCKFRAFMKMRLKKVHVAVVTAGTNAGHGYDVYHGTTSIGTIALGTSAANTVGHSGLLNELVDTMEQISVKSLVDATGVAHVVYEYQTASDAVHT